MNREIDREILNLLREIRDEENDLKRAERHKDEYRIKISKDTISRKTELLRILKA